MWVESFDVNKNFWKENSQLAIIFSDLYDADENKSKELSSIQMWAIAFFIDSASKWKNMTNKKKRENIRIDWLEKKLKDLKSYKNISTVDDIMDWDSEVIKKAITTYQEYDTSKTNKLLYEWEKKLEERNDFISGKEYSENTYEMLDKMLAASKKMWDEYLRIKKDASEATEEGEGEGGGEESDSEKMAY